MSMIECPNCKMIDLPPAGGECEACGIPTFFGGADIINNLRDLAKHLGVEPVTSFENFGPDGLVGRMRKAIYRATECGCVLEAPKGERYVIISGYAEGADAECESYQLSYPFSAEEFDQKLALCDLEGCQMWEEWNNPDWEDVLPDDMLEEQDNA